MYCKQIVCGGVALLFSATSAFSHHSFSSLSTYFVFNDNGGRIVDYAVKVAAARKSDHLIKFMGPCQSACTLYLSLPAERVCVERGAQFGFHKPYGSSIGGNIRAADYLMRKYPDWVKHWLANRGGLSQGMKYMDADYAAQFLGYC